MFKAYPYFPLLTMLLLERKILLIHVKTAVWRRREMGGD